MLIAVAVVVYLLLKSYRKSNPAQDRPGAEDMVRCAHCGIHIPKSESINAGGNYFCGPEHRDAYRK